MSRSRWRSTGSSPRGTTAYHSIEVGDNRRVWYGIEIWAEGACGRRIDEDGISGGRIVTMGL